MDGKQDQFCPESVEGFSMSNRSSIASMMNRGSNSLERFILLFFLACMGLSVWFVLRDREIPAEPPDERLESVDSNVFEGERSAQWASVRNEFVSKNPSCAACGSRKDLNVHHIKPFHSNPELELDMKNLITLCREHHFRIGHDPDGPFGPLKPSWKESNPFVRKHSQLWRDAR